MTSSTSSKTKENRLRRMARRQGLLLVKSRRRDRYAAEFGQFVLVADCRGNRIGRHGGQEGQSLLAQGWGTNLDGIEKELAS